MNGASIKRPSLNHQDIPKVTKFHPYQQYYNWTPGHVDKKHVYTGHVSQMSPVHRLRVNQNNLIYPGDLAPAPTVGLPPTTDMLLRYSAANGGNKI